MYWSVRPPGGPDAYGYTRAEACRKWLLKKGIHVNHKTGESNMSEPINLKTLSTEEAVAMAMLLGCEFWMHAYVDDKPVWHVTSDLHTLHPIEQRQSDRTGLPGYRSKDRLARAYLRWCLVEQHDGR